MINRPVSLRMNNNFSMAYYSEPSVQGFETGITLLSAGDMGFEDGKLGEEKLNSLHRLGFPDMPLFTLKQIHSKTIHIVGSGTDQSKLKETIRTGDGLLTDDAHIILAVTVADCLPVYLFDDNRGIFGILHSGWKGTGIAAEAVKLMKEKWNSKPENISAVLGPAIGACCYTVDKSRAEIFRNEWGDSAVLHNPEDGTYRLDLKKANEMQLEQCGIRVLYNGVECTECSEKFGSFRREGPRQFTRMLAFIGKIT